MTGTNVSRKLKQQNYGFAPEHDCQSGLYQNEIDKFSNLGLLARMSLYFRGFNESFSHFHPIQGVTTFPNAKLPGAVIKS